MILKNKNAKIAMLIALSIACCSLDPTHAFSSTTSHGSRRFRISSSSATSRSSLSQHVLGTETSGSKMKININRVTATRQQAIVQHQRRWQQLPSLSMSSVEGDFDPEALARAREDVKAGSIKARLRALYKFTRPHTIRGTILGSIAGTVRALLDTPGALANARWGTMLPRAFVGMFALLLGNAFIVGINQIYDQDIDKMNKPFLPVASGEMSNRAAWLAVLVSGSVGPLIVHKFFPPLLFQLYTAGLVLGGVYSVPPIRTKKNPILAGLTIAIVRGFLLNFGVYYAVKDAFGSAFSWSPKVAFVARFMTIFATVIAVTKDLPDIEGDKVSVCVYDVHVILFDRSRLCSVCTFFHCCF